MKTSILILTFLLIFLCSIPLVSSIPNYISNPSPTDGETDVNVTAKGVQTCADITIPTGCTGNITFSWLNQTEYYNAWLAWRNNTGPKPTTANHTYTYYTWTNVNTSTTYCYENPNVTCSTENKWNENFIWTVTLELNCSGKPSIFTETYSFKPEPCDVFYIYPPPFSTNICPCCSEICAGITNPRGHPMDIKFFIKEQNETCYNNIATFNSKYNGTYCFCFDGYDIQPHAVGHTRAEIIPLAINTWYNVTFQTFDSIGITGTPSEVIIPEDGHYSIDFFAICTDNNVNPFGDKIAFRFTRNGAEINSSYQELDFQKQDNLREVISLAHTILNKGDKINFQYIVNDVNIHIREDATWSSNNTSAYASIVRVDNYHIPIKYNQTYYWYINVTDTIDGTQYNSDIFTINTETDPENCLSGEEVSEQLTIHVDSATDRSQSYLIGGLLVLPLVFVFLNKRRKK